jgi:hypothetical protein
VRKLLFGNLSTKLLALVLALLLWYIAFKETMDQETWPDVVVGVVDSPEGTAVSCEPAAVRVRIDGPRRTIDRLVADVATHLDRLAVKIPYRELGPSGEPVDLEPTMLEGVPENVLEACRVTFEPERVNVVRERLETRRIAVRVHAIGEPAVGYAFDRLGTLVDGEPEAVASVTVTARASAFADPAQRLSLLANVVVHGNRSFDVSGVRIEPAIRELDPTTGEWVPTGFEAVSIGPERVQVHVEIAEEFVRREISGVPVKIYLTPDFSFKVKIQKEKDKTVTAYVRGPKELVEKALPEEILAYIAMDPARGRPTPGMSPRTPVFVLPKGMEWDAAVEKPSVIIEIEKPPPPPPAPPTGPGG